MSKIIWADKRDNNKMVFRFQNICYMWWLFVVPMKCWNTKRQVASSFKIELNQFTSLFSRKIDFRVTCWWFEHRAVLQWKAAQGLHCVYLVIQVSWNNERHLHGINLGAFSSGKVLVPSVCQLEYCSMPQFFLEIWKKHLKWRFPIQAGRYLKTLAYLSPVQKAALKTPLLSQ